MIDSSGVNAEHLHTRKELVFGCLENELIKMLIKIVHIADYEGEGSKKKKKMKHVSVRADPTPPPKQFFLQFLKKI